MKKEKSQSSKERQVIDIPFGRRMTEEEWRSLPSPEKFFRNFRMPEAPGLGNIPLNSSVEKVKSNSEEPLPEGISEEDYISMSKYLSLPVFDPEKGNI